MHFLWFCSLGLTGFLLRNLRYHNTDTMLSTIEPYYGNLNLKPHKLKGILIGPYYVNLN